MPKKAERVTPLPAGLVPLLTQRQLETYYGVSDWLVIQWIKAGMPVKYVKTPTATYKKRRFDLSAVESWHADQDQLAATA